MAGDRGLAFVVISLISFSAFSVLVSRRASPPPKLGVVKTVTAGLTNTDAAGFTANQSHVRRIDRITPLEPYAEVISGTPPHSFAPGTLASIPVHPLPQRMDRDIRSRAGAEFGLQ